MLFYIKIGYCDLVLIDRIYRFLYNCEIEIIDNTEKSEQQELVEDLVQISQYSVANYKENERIKQETYPGIDTGERDGKSHKSNVNTK